MQQNSSVSPVKDQTSLALNVYTVWSSGGALIGIQPYSFSSLNEQGTGSEKINPVTWRQTGMKN